MIAIVFQSAAAVIALTAAIMAWKLERRLIRLRTGQDGMQKAAATLTEAVARAEASVRNLRAEGAEAAAELEGLIERARATADELRLMNDAPARRRPARPAHRPAAQPAPERSARPTAEPLDLDLDLDLDLQMDPEPRPLPASLRPQGADLIEALRRVR